MPIYFYEGEIRGGLRAEMSDIKTIINVWHKKYVDL